MVFFPNCKVNIGLHVKGKRPDGYHNLETVFYPVPLRDAAEVTPYTVRTEHAPFELNMSGEPVPGEVSTNLCTRAWQLIKADYPDIPPVRMHLHKRIPTGAGLGGGSADGAFMLLLLNEVCKLNIGSDKLRSYALQLGSDCPFFIVNKPCYAAGRGEIIEPISLDLSDYYFVIVYPGIHIHTGDVFKQLGDMRRSTAGATENETQANTLKDVVMEPVSTWKNVVVNDFELPVFERHPEIKHIKEQLYFAGAEYASMTGTGSSVFGIFHNSKKAGNLVLPNHYKVFNLKQSN